MSGPALVLAIASAWLAIGVVLALVLGRRGHSGFSWFVLGIMLGPLAIALAVDAWRRDEPGEARVLAPSAGAEAGAVDVLVGFDASPESRAALDAAVELMGTRMGRLTMATVIPYDDGKDGERAAVAALEGEARRLAWLAPGLEVLRGHPATALTTRAAEDGYDIVVAGTRGSGHAHLFGSAAGELARTSKVPVLLVGPGGNR